MSEPEDMPGDTRRDAPASSPADETPAQVSPEDSSRAEVEAPRPKGPLLSIKVKGGAKSGSGPLSLEERLELSAYLDGELDEGEARALELKIHSDPRRARELAELREVASLAGEAVPLPSEEAWGGFMRDLDEELAHQVPPRTRDPLMRFFAAAAVLSLCAFVAQRFADPPVSLALPRLPSKTCYLQPQQVDAPRAGVLPPLREVERAATAALSTRSRLDLASEGLVQVADAGLPTLREPSLAGPRPLATADASLLLFNALSERAALQLERGLIRPRLVELLALLDRELEGVEEEGGYVGWHALRTRARLAVAARLVGVSVSLPEGFEEDVEAELLRVRRAELVTQSKLLGRSLDYRLFRVRGLHAGEASDHSRAVRWLDRAALRVDTGDPDEVAQAALLGIALARGRAGDETGLGLQLRLEAAIELLFGPPDDLTPTDVLAGLREVVGRLELRPRDVDARVALRLALRLREEAKARRTGRVRRFEDRVVLIGATRSEEAVLATRLSTPSLPGRQLPRSLDLFAVWGSRRARTALSALDPEVSGYDQAIARLRPEALERLDAERGIPLRASLERARHGALAALLSEGPGLPSQRAASYRDRLLLAALAGLNGPGPAAERLPSEDELARGPVPLVEPLPRLHRRLAFEAKRIAEALEVMAPTHTLLALRQLRRFARLEEALADASLDLLRGDAVPSGTQRELRALCPLFRAWVPREVRSLADVYEVHDAAGVRILQRAVFRADRLYLVVPELETGRPTLGCGPALVADEVESAQGPLLPSELASRGLKPPLWASHLEGK